MTAESDRGNKFLNSWRQRAKLLKAETRALYLAFKDPRTPRPAKLAIACVIAYALCPIDLIPDFIPVLGYLDDLILIPLGIILAVKLIPAEVMADCREAAAHAGTAPKLFGKIAAVLIVTVWAAAVLWLISIVLKFIKN